MRTNMTKPSAAVGLLSVLALGLAACGGGSAAEQGQPQDDTAETAESADGLRVAILTSGPVSDAGYNADAQRAADYIEAELGGQVSVSESVPVPNQAEVYRQFASQGYDLVIGWGGQFTDGAVEVAEAFPDVNFLVVNSGVSNGSNLASIDQAIEQWSFTAGWLQAKLSETGTSGWVGAQCF